MKNLPLFFFAFLFIVTETFSQSRIYSIPVVVENTYLRDSAHVVGRLDLDFPVDGRVFISFDGIGSGTPGDRIILSANHYPDWDSNDGNVNFSSTVEGEEKCFSHTRTIPVTAGQHSFYAIAHNVVDTEGTGYATIYGTLYVEFIPSQSAINTASSIVINEFDISSPIAYDSITIEASSAGNLELRLNGTVGVDPGIVAFIDISDTKNWNFNAPEAIALQSKFSHVPYETFSKTKIVEVPGPGIYTYYAMVQGELSGSGEFYAYTHMHARFYPETSSNEVVSKFISRENLNLPPSVVLLDSIEINVEQAGSVEVRFDGELNSLLNQSILLGVNDQPVFDTQSWNVILQTVEDGFNTHPFVHTRFFDVTPGLHKYYVLAEHFDGASSTQVDLKGDFMVKYYPAPFISANKNISELAFTMYPNPVQDRVFIQYENVNDEMEVSIFDLQGRKVRQIGSIESGETVDISTLLPGVYVVQVSLKGGIGHQKLIKD